MMHKFALVSPSGEIMQTGTASREEDMLLQASSRPDLALVECDAVYGLHYFKDGNVKEYPDRPSQHHKFDHDAEAWIDARTADDLAEEARQKRNALLAQSDWTQVPDAPVDKAAWATYRQALRDITKQSGFPLEVIWPNKPQ